MFALLLSFGSGKCAARCNGNHETGRARPSGRANQTLANLVFCLAVSSMMIPNGSQGGTQIGKPCICNSTFYKACPPDNDCMENVKPETTETPASTTGKPNGSNSTGAPSASTTKIPDYYDDDDYDDDDGSGDWFAFSHLNDPDHAPNIRPFDTPPQNPAYHRYLPDAYWSTPTPNNLAYPRKLPDGYRSTPRRGDLRPEAPDPLLFLPSQGDRVVHHRKIYVTPKKDRVDVPIHPIRIRIPVRVPEYAEPSLPAPKPVFKLKKYTTYESRPEVQMVPVTKTIIRPVGVDANHIIDETGGDGKDKKLLLRGS